MLDRSEAQLIGFLLNALEDEEREQVQRELARRPEWRRKLRRLRRFFRLLEEARGDFVPPPDLVERTCRLVARDRVVAQKRCGAMAHPGTACLGDGGQDRPPRTWIGVVGFRWAPLSDHWSGDRSAWSPLDLLSAAIVTLLLLAILFPALVETRFRYQVTACQENFHRLYGTLSDYAGLSPTRELADVAGDAVSLVSLMGGPMAKTPLLGCPGWCHGPSTKAQKEHAPGGGTEQPGKASSSVSGYALAGFTLSPTGADRSEMSLHPAAVVIWRDARVFDGCNLRCWNHFGRGENWLFADGHVQFMPQAAINDWERRSTQLVSLARSADR